MIFKPDIYYVGDPGFVLPSDDLRVLFAELMKKNANSKLNELKPIISSRHFENDQAVYDYYWIATTPHRQGTVYDKNNKGWGFDWGCFGVVPWKWINCSGTYLDNKVEFTEPFECFGNEDGITIGHLYFNFNPK